MRRMIVSYTALCTILQVIVMGNCLSLLKNQFFTDLIIWTWNFTSIFKYNIYSDLPLSFHVICSYFRVPASMFSFDKYMN